MGRRALLAVVLIVGGLVAVPTPAEAATLSVKTMLGQLAVRSEHTAGYARSKFKLWVDADHDGCNTRAEVLISEAKIKPQVGAGCALTGGKWVSPYDAVTVTSASKLDIDHLVPLAEAWQSGAYKWNADTRMRYANDLGYGPDLVAVTAHANRSKGDREPSAYLPPRKSFDCTYEAWWVAVKWRWHLSVNSAEKSWLTSHLKSCGWPKVTKPTRPRIGSGSTGGGGTGAGASIDITGLQYDSPGADDGSNASLNAEWIQLTNTGSGAVTLTGWTITDAQSHRYAFPTATLAAHATVKVHTGHGTDTSTNRYWNSGAYIWNNTGDTATLRNPGGTTVAEYGYATGHA